MFNLNVNDIVFDKIGSLFGNLKEKNVNFDFFYYKNLLYFVFDVKGNFWLYRFFFNDYENIW